MRGDPEFPQLSVLVLGEVTSTAVLWVAVLQENQFLPQLMPDNQSLVDDGLLTTVSSLGLGVREVDDCSLSR
jgi:hypothetical protein